jgi:prohibitin 2
LKEGGTMNRFALFVLFALSPGCACYVVDPGNRGVKVTLGEVSPGLLPEGFGTKSPWSSVHEVSVRQRAEGLKSACFSSDLQQVNITLRVLFRVPDSAVIPIFREYAGDPFVSLVTPRVQEALKEVTAMSSAEGIVKGREAVKFKALAAAKAKIGNLIVLEDLVIENIDLSNELEHAIEAKMVQEQEASKAHFIQQKAEIEAQTAVVRAKGEAEAIHIRGEALKATPSFIELQIVEKWDGKSPLVVGSSGSPISTILPLGKP